MSFCSVATHRPLINGTVGARKAIVGTIEQGAGLLPVLVQPTFVLGLEDAAGVVAKGDEGGQALSHESRTVGT